MLLFHKRFFIKSVFVPTLNGTIDLEARVNRRFVTICLLGILPISLYAQNTTRRNGVWWNAMTENTKIVGGSFQWRPHESDSAAVSSRFTSVR